MYENRESFRSSFGLFAAAVGSAVGLGNIWRFPYITGINGGAAFILVYLICVAIIGIPVLLSEFIIGREGKSNPIDAFKKTYTRGKVVYKWNIRCNGSISNTIFL